MRPAQMLILPRCAFRPLAGCFRVSSCLALSAPLKTLSSQCLSSTDSTKGSEALERRSCWPWWAWRTASRTCPLSSLEASSSALPLPEGAFQEPGHHLVAVAILCAGFAGSCDPLPLEPNSARFCPGRMCSLANDPKLLLLDEAVADLDTKNQVDVMNLLLRINLERKVTMIMVTQ